MTGFLTGVSVNIVLRQVADLTGAEAHGSTNLAKVLDVLLHPGGISGPSLLTGVAAGAVVVLLRDTKVSSFAAVIALVIPTAGQFTRAGGPCAERVTAPTATDVISESSAAAYARAQL